MGRGRVQLKRIENKISRQVTFSKRRSGLLKKAHEISVLCDAEVGLIVFSTKGKLFEYATDSCMDRILERYERYCFTERQVGLADNQAPESKSPEYPMLLSKLQLLQRNMRHYMGEDLDALSLRELQHLEQQLDTALKRIRNRKNQVMHEFISELQKKEKALQEQNKMLAKKVGGETQTIPPPVQQEQHLIQSSSTLVFPSSSTEQPLPPPSLSIGGTFQQTREDRTTEGHDWQQAQIDPTAAANNSAALLPWMFRHAND